MTIYDALIKPILFTLPPETAHHLGCTVLSAIEKKSSLQGLSQSLFCPHPAPTLSQTVFEQTYPHPLGLAAGFDKNARYPKALSSMGFSYLELGSMSYGESQGNPSPRLFRLPKDEALINRMGLNNDGLIHASPRLQDLSDRGLLQRHGLSLTKTPGAYGDAAIEDFKKGLELAIQLDVAYLALNVSCPNTADGKSFETPEALERLLYTLREEEGKYAEHKRPWMLKLSADIDDAQLDELVEIGRTQNVAGWILSNTSTRRDLLQYTSSARISEIGNGGLSGLPIRQASTDRLAQVYLKTRHWESRPVLIGVGGINDVDSAWEKITHGANLLQCYTGWIYKGPSLLKTIVSGLASKLEEAGYATLNDAIGSALK